MYYIFYVEQQNFLAVFDEAENCSHGPYIQRCALSTHQTDLI